jgi:hypothetical protein
MSRAIPSFRLALAMEEIEWRKPFHNALSESNMKKD